MCEASQRTIAEYSALVDALRVEKTALRSALEFAFGALSCAASDDVTHWCEHCDDDQESYEAILETIAKALRASGN